MTSQARGWPWLSLRFTGKYLVCAHGSAHSTQQPRIAKRKPSALIPANVAALVTAYWDWYYHKLRTDNCAAAGTRHTIKPMLLLPVLPDCCHVCAKTAYNCTTLPAAAQKERTYLAAHADRCMEHARGTSASAPQVMHNVSDQVRAESTELNGIDVFGSAIPDETGQAEVGACKAGG